MIQYGLTTEPYRYGTSFLELRSWKEKTMSVWQGVAMDSLKFYPGLPCSTFLRPAGGPPLKWLYGHFGGGPSTERAACGCLLPLWTLHVKRLCKRHLKPSRGKKQPG
jgi:hypothetical protein